MLLELNLISFNGNFIVPPEYDVTVEQHMLTIDTLKLHWNVVFGFPAAHCVRPSIAKSNLADEVPWVSLDHVKGCLVSFFPCQVFRFQIEIGRNFCGMFWDVTVVVCLGCLQQSSLMSRFDLMSSVSFVLHQNSFNLFLGDPSYYFYFLFIQNISPFLIG